MSVTDLYGARVLALSPDRLRVRLRIFVVHYDETELPDDPVLILRILWDGAQGGPLAEHLEHYELLDEGWIGVNTRWFVQGYERLVTRNQDTDLADYEGELENGGWPEENRLLQADYEITVTDPRWLDHLSLGTSWASGWYPSPMSRMRPDEAAEIPDLNETVARLVPFPYLEDGADLNGLAFSDDGSSLGVCNEAGDVVVLDAGTWERRAPRDGETFDFVLVPPPSLPVEDDDDFAVKAVSRGSTTLAARGSELFVVESGKVAGRFEVGGEEVGGLALSPDGRFGAVSELATGDFPVVWNLADGRPVLRCHDRSCVDFLAWSPDGRWLAAATRRQVRVYGVGLPDEPPFELRQEGTPDEALPPLEGLAEVELYLGLGNPHAVRAALERLSGDEYRRGCDLCVENGADLPRDHPLAEVLTTLDGDARSIALSRWLRGMTSHEAGDEADAIAAWRESAATGVRPFSTRSGTGLAVLGAATPEELDDRLVVELANDLLDRKDDRALAAFQMAPESGPAAYGIARVHEENDAVAEAIEAYERAVELEEGVDMPDALSRLGLLRQRLGDAEGAVEATREARERAVTRDDRAATAQALGIVLVNQERWAEAQVAYQDGVDALNEAVAHGRVWWPRHTLLTLGQVQEKAGDHDAARTTFLHLVELNKDHEGDQEREIWTLACAWLGIMAKDARDVVTAEAWFQQVIDSGSPEGNRAWATAHLGELHHWLGNHEDAAGYYARTLELGDEDVLVAEAAYRLGEHKARKGEIDEAIALMERTLATGFDGFDLDANALLETLRGVT
ncbi:WD40 repeat domain-containing protein [Actinomadura oligospora]|uniref:WD40 repeat domain-containing protein n=1 Tax=Actinomadura oligospora TaxID=111804 RepID=UPI00047B7365|nr:tetratricopeptide repeat protein [Actinomadura oligospora]